jgi:hypothetical protein
MAELVAALRSNRAGLEPALKKIESELGGVSILVNKAHRGAERGCVAGNA